MYIICRLLPETSYWPAVKIFLSTSDFKHGDHRTLTKTHEACAQQVQTAVIIYKADHDNNNGPPFGHSQQQTTRMTMQI